MVIRIISIRNFYCTYKPAPEAIEKTMTIDRTQNVVILEAEPTLQEQTWYIQSLRQYGWSKLELQQKIASKVHTEKALDFAVNVCYTEEDDTIKEWLNYNVILVHVF